MLMESIKSPRVNETSQDLLPDRSMQKRIGKVGAVGVSALALVGSLAVDQMANAEVRPEPKSQVVSAEELHGLRVDTSEPTIQQKETEKSVENKAEYVEPAEWWPVGVRENWLKIQATAREYELDPYLVATIVAEESGGQNIQNQSGATGLMQIMPGTAQEVARLRHRAYYNMHDIAQNLDYGCWLIHYIDQKYISGQGVELETDFGIAMLAVGYGDGEGALQVWAQNGYQPQHLSDQARHVTPLWSDMYHSKDKPKSLVYAKQRGSK